MRLSMLLLSALLSLLAAPARGGPVKEKSLRQVKVGDRVRLTCDVLALRQLRPEDQPGDLPCLSILTGAFLGLDGGAVSLRTADREVSVPLQVVRRMEVGRGSGLQRRALTGAFIGGLVGAASIAIVHASIASSDSPVGGGDYLAGGAVGLATGAGLGALIGAAKGETTERWAPVAVPFPQSGNRPGSITVAIRVRP